MELKDAIQNLTGFSQYSLKRLKGGGAANTFCLLLPDNSELILKGKGRSLDLMIEARMLTYLAEKTDLPAPKVLISSADFLILQKLSGESGSLKLAEECLARKLLSLHSVTQEEYGFDYDTPYSQVWTSNTKQLNWIDFYRENRLLHALQRAVDTKKIPAQFVSRIEEVAENLDRWIIEPKRPSLLHGDLWHGNVLTKENRVTSLIDPALFYGDAEYEFATATWKKELTKSFFEIYFSDQGGISDGFAMRQRVYQLFPVLAYILVSSKPKFIRLNDILSRLGA